MHQVNARGVASVLIIITISIYSLKKVPFNRLNTHGWRRRPDHLGIAIMLVTTIIAKDRIVAF